MEKDKYYKVGEIVDNTMVISGRSEHALCSKCKFYEKSLEYCMPIKCSPSTRPDGEWVYFKPITQV